MQNSLKLETDKSYYLPGDMLNGVVHVMLEKSTKIRHLDVQFYGREKVTIDPAYVAPVASKAHYSSTNELSNFFLRFLENQVLPAGDTKIPFQFQLPLNALPSFLGRYTDVTWKLSARMDIPWAADLNDTVYLRVWTRSKGVLSQPAIENPEPHPKVSLKLESNLVEPGEMLRGQLVVQDLGNLRSVRVQLLQTEDATARGVVTGVMEAHRTDSRIIGYASLFKREQLPTGSPVEFALPVPQEATTSYRGVWSTVYWNVIATLDIPYAGDVQIQAPLLVALRTFPSPAVPVAQEKIPITVGAGGSSLVARASTEPQEGAWVAETPGSPLPVSSISGKEDIGSMIMKILGDSGSKDLLAISSELQQTATGYVDLNTVMRDCEELVSQGHLKQTGTGEFFAQYSLAQPS